jgi:hypothetical protein
MRLEDAKAILGDIVANGGQMTIANVLERFRAYLENPKIWDISTSAKDVTSVPELQVFTIFNPSDGYARVQLADRKRYLTLIDQMSQQTAHVDRRAFATNLQSNLAKNFIPYFTLFHQSSFFADAKFEIVQDERMRSIFIQERNKPSRTTVVAGQDPLVNSADQGIAAPMVLYRSAVKGTIKMIGNFVFSYAGLVWINFNIPAIDGLFYVMQKVDAISGDGFFSTYQFQAEGSNPLGVPAKPGETAEDYVKEMIQTALESPNYSKIYVLRTGADTGAVDTDALGPVEESSATDTSPWNGADGKFFGGGASGYYNDKPIESK